MNKKMMKCKVCGSELSSSEKTCPNCGGKIKKPIFKKWWFWLIVIIIIIIIAVNGSNEQTKKPSTSQPVVDKNTAPPETSTPETAAPETASPEITKVPEDTEVPNDTPAQTDTATTEQKNALRSANNYLKFTAFSYSGLVKQLEFEKYSTETATYAADHCGADWNEQAVKAAQSYLKYSSFSRDSLIQQLEFEGYTNEQAVYGTDTVYSAETNTNSNDANSSDVTTEQTNALASAKSYLEFSAFSYKGLIKQLEFEKYSTEAATYAADQCGADWNEQAVKAAKSYLEYSSFSRSSLIQQLEFEGFTSEQAEHGAKENGY